MPSERRSSILERRHSDGSFFGRRRGKALRPTQRHALDTLLPELRLDLAAPPPPDPQALFPAPVDAVRLEIGFGGGEHLLEAAARLPRIGFIGVEPFDNGMAKALAAIGRDGLSNIRVFDRDAALLLDWLPAHGLERVDLLYPDPWPKTRHRSRRFVNQANLDRIVRVLLPDGEFRFASDVEAYVKWTLREVAAHGALACTTTEPARLRLPWAHWPGTRYEAKALREGRRPAYLSFRTRGSSLGDGEGIAREDEHGRSADGQSMDGRG